MRGTEEMDEPTSPGADLPPWAEELVGAVVVMIISTLAVEALDGLLFRTDLPWKVCAVMGVVMAAGTWAIFRDAGLLDRD